MKKILITGKDSYVGRNIEVHLCKEPEKYKVNTIDMRNEGWNKHDFSKYDVVFHVAGIVHLKEKRKNADSYFKVNRDLAIKVAEKAKKSGVRQFIFMSSMSVYGISKGNINKFTFPKPNTYYGKSKHEAEIEIKKLGNSDFKVLILRTPMIYGEKSPGNYNRLIKLSKHMRFIPKIENKRSAISICNLAFNIKKYIEQTESGIIVPQDSEYFNTNKNIISLRLKKNKKTSYSFIFTIIVKLLIKFSKTIGKLYGDLYYE